MNEIVIKIEINSNNDINVSNAENEKSFTIDYKNKYISAASVYDVLSYKPGYTIRIEKTGDGDVSDEKVKRYFAEIVDIFEKIRSNLSTISVKDPNKDINEIDYSDDESSMDLPF